MTVSIANLTSQWTNGVVSYTGIGLNVTATAYAAGSYILNYKLNGTIRYTLDPQGNVYVDGSHTVNSSARVNGSLVVINTLTSESVGANTITANTVTANIISCNTVTSNTVNANTLYINNIVTNTISITTSTGNVIANNITSNTFVSDSKGDLRNEPVVDKSTPYEIALIDTGRIISTSAAIYVPNTVFFAGNVVSVYNNSGLSITLTQNSSVTMHLSGTATTGNRTLAQRGFATIRCIAANTFVISGSGLT